MNVELFVLTWSVVLGFIHIVASSHAKSLQHGYRWTAGARDEEVPPLRGVAGRLERASSNYLETFPFFAALVLAAQVAGIHSALTEWGFTLVPRGSRRLFPLYVLGIPLVRSLVWNLRSLACFCLSSRYCAREDCNELRNVVQPPNRRL